MSKLLFAAAAIAFVGLPPACKKSDAPPAAVEKTTAKSDLPAFHAPLTVATVMSAKTAAEPLQPWDDTFATLQAHFGPPTKIDGKKFEWAAMEGDRCAYFVIEKVDGAEYKQPGTVVGSFQHPQTYGKDGAIMNRGECLDILGKGAPPEDPNAPGPSGTKVGVGELVKHAVAARSKWDGKQLDITGTVKQSGSTVVLADASDPSATVMASLAAGVADPELGKPITLHCTVKLQKLVSGAGQPSMEADLDGCTKP
ncbi:MAG TPA: hypothetical protein VH143_32520 [Kofleriaceae bacterium]|nr:hypothetical protein [Kofleriaceae bacterium]